MSKPEADMQPAPEQPTSPFLTEALSYLTGEGRTRTPAVLLDDLRTRFREAGREKLADLVYEMAKACLKQLPDFAARFELREEPRKEEVISGEMGTMAGRLEGLSWSVDLAEVPTRRPEETQALENASKCVTVLKELEGDTGRELLVGAMCHAYSGRYAEAEELLRHALADRSDSNTICFYANLNMAFTLIRLGRDDEAIDHAERAMSIDPASPMPCCNIATAAARLGNRERFVWAVRHLGELNRRSPSEFLHSWWQNWGRHQGEHLGIAEEKLADLALVEEGSKDR